MKKNFHYFMVELKNVSGSSVNNSIKPSLNEHEQAVKNNSQDNKKYVNVIQSLPRSNLFFRTERLR